MTTTHLLAINRRSRRRHPLGFGRRPHAPSCTSAPDADHVVLGRLVVTRLGPADPARPASISSVSVRAPTPVGPAPVVLHYRQGGAAHSLNKARGYWAVAAEAALGRPGLSARSHPRAGAPVAASTTGS